MKEGCYQPSLDKVDRVRGVGVWINYNTMEMRCKKGQKDGFKRKRERGVCCRCRD